MDQFNKTDINDISISYVYEIKSTFSMSCIYIDYKIFVMQGLL